MLFARFSVGNFQAKHLRSSKHFFITNPPTRLVPFLEYGGVAWPPLKAAPLCGVRTPTAVIINVQWGGEHAPKPGFDCDTYVYRPLCRPRPVLGPFFPRYATL